MCWNSNFWTFQISRIDFTRKSLSGRTFLKFSIFILWDGRINRFYNFFAPKTGNTGINIMNRTEPGWRIERKQTQKLVEVKDRSSTIDNSPKNKWLIAATTQLCENYSHSDFTWNQNCQREAQNLQNKLRGFEFSILWILAYQQNSETPKLQNWQF